MIRPRTIPMKKGQRESKRKKYVRKTAETFSELKNEIPGSKAHQGPKEKHFKRPILSYPIQGLWLLCSP